MTFSWPRAFFVSGTDTNIGKTFVSGLLAIGLRGSYWKPVQSGLDPHSDSDWIRTVCNLPDERIIPERHKLSQPLSPHLAARLDGVKINLSDFELPQFTNNPLIIEGAGGLLVPLNADYYVADLIRQLHVPVLLVARSTLGTINHTLLSVSLIRQKNIRILGVVMNGPINEENKRAIENYGKVPVIAQIPFLESVTEQSLKAGFDKYVSPDFWSDEEAQQAALVRG